MQDSIFLEGVEAYTRLGVYPPERKRGQCVKFNLRLDLDLSKPGISDDIQDTISYVDVSREVQNIAQAKEYNLIEHLSTEICRGLFEKFEKLSGIEIRVFKTVINAEGFVGNASVRLYRRQESV
jgi:dihydroneopterin aldolase